MINKRLGAHLVTPRYEDAGLFGTELCRLDVKLLPGARRNDRHDFIFTGIIDRGHRVPVFFAGRRAADAQALVVATDRIRRQRVAAGGPAPDAEPQALALRIDGAWRKLVHQDAQGFAQVTHQFIAAMWSIGAGDAAARRYGTPPVL